MFKHIIAEAGNINWMAIFALLTFVFVFTVSIVMIFFAKKTHIDRMAHLPLEENNSSNPQEIR